MPATVAWQTAIVQSFSNRGICPHMVKSISPADDTVRASYRLQKTVRLADWPNVERHAIAADTFQFCINRLHDFSNFIFLIENQKQDTHLFFASADGKNHREMRFTNLFDVANNFRNTANQFLRWSLGWSAY